MSVVIGVQRRFMQLGRVRLGEKGSKGEPKKLNSFRFTSASERLLEAVAAKYGGTVSAWTDAPDEGYYQVTTEATSLDIILPPTFSQEDGSPSTSYSQWYELWSKGGCQRRCDGVTESLSGEPCKCDPSLRDSGEDPKGTCGIITRVSFIIPDLPGLGVWRLDSGGWNAAVELPGTLELLAQAANEQRFIPAVLSLQNRTKKVGGQTRRFVVPVIELPDVTIGELVNGTAPTYALNAPGPVDRSKPALPAAPAPPEDPAFDHDANIEFGTPPALPQDSSGKGAVSHAGEEGPRSPTPAAGGPDDQGPVSAAPSPGPSLLKAAEAETLTRTLLEIVTKLWADDPEKDAKLLSVTAAVVANHDEHADDPAKHVGWLRGQIERAEAAA